MQIEIACECFVLAGVQDKVVLKPCVEAPEVQVTVSPRAVYDLIHGLTSLESEIRSGRLKIAGDVARLRQAERAMHAALHGLVRAEHGAGLLRDLARLTGR